MPKKDKHTLWLLLLLGLIAVLWLALLVAPCLGDGLAGILTELPQALNHPLHIKLCDESGKAVLVFVCGYMLFVAVQLSSDKNYRRREEHGSAKWGNVRDIQKRYADPELSNNILLTEHIRISINVRLHLRNLNVIIIGGSGAGKSYMFARPNICICGCSYVITDPKGEAVRALGFLLEAQGYEVVVLDLIHMDKSHCYNPFVYIRNDNDVQRLVTALFKATTPIGSQSNDPFWDQAAKMLLSALIYYLHYEAPEEEQNFGMVMELLREGDVHEDDDNYKSPLDILFMMLEKKNPDHIAVKYYKSYHSGSAKTLKSIQVTLAARLEKFNLDSVVALTSTDELHLGDLGKKKMALFAVIPDNDTSFNFLVSMMYTQLFQQLFHVADDEFGGSLPQHVELVLDEFANLALPDDFDKILSVMRSRNISVDIILQNMAQLKALYEKQYESIVGNCDSFLYMGGNEQSTHKYVSELLGKETIDLDTYNVNKGRNGSYTKNGSVIGRDLMIPDEVRALDNRYAILFIRGERPIIDEKIHMKKLPNAWMTTDGGYKPYRYGESTLASATVTVQPVDKNKKQPEITVPEDADEYVFLSDEDMDAFLAEHKEENPNEKAQPNP